MKPKNEQIKEQNMKPKNEWIKEQSIKNQKRMNE